MGALKVKGSEIPLSEIDFPTLLSAVETTQQPHLRRRANYIAALFCSHEPCDFPGNGDITRDLVTSLLFSETIPLRVRSSRALFNGEMKEGM